MDEQANSWIMRTKFSSTVCHRLDASKLAPVPFILELDRTLGAKSRPRVNLKPGSDVSRMEQNLTIKKQGAASPLSEEKPSHTVCHWLEASKLASVPSIIEQDRAPVAKDIHGVNLKPGSDVSQMQQNMTINKQEATLSQEKLSDTFKKTWSSQNRARKEENEKRILSKSFHKDSRETKSSALKLSMNTCPVRLLPSMKLHEKPKSHKESAWTKYFDHGVGRVTCVETSDQHMIDLSKLFLGLRFAHGAHSQLYHGTYMEEHVAVKIIRVPDNDEDGALGEQLEKQFTREVALLSRLHHRNVIKFIAGCRKQPVFCIVTEYLSEGSLRSYLHKLEHNSIPLQKTISMALDIARGMEYIHSQGIIHRDLKPENILMAEDFHLKVADFGTASGEEDYDLLGDDPGTYRWMAPEMIRRKHYNRKVDVYSFGLILWEFVARTIPFEDMTPMQAAFAVVDKKLRPSIPGDCPPAMKALIEQCWSLQPDNRPEFWQIVKALEEFDSSLSHDGTLNFAPNLPYRDHHKKGFLHWIHKYGHTH